MPKGISEISFVVISGFISSISRILFWFLERPLGKSSTKNCQGIVKKYINDKYN